MSQHLISTAAQPMIHRCGSLILEGWCEGLRTRVDPFPTEPLTEAVALILGRWCYVLTSQKILERRAGSIRSGPVLVEHVCGAPLTFPTDQSRRPDSVICTENDVPPY